MLQNAGNDCIARGRVDNPQADFIFVGLCIAQLLQARTTQAQACLQRVIQWRVCARCCSPAADDAGLGGFDYDNNTGRQ